MVGVEEWEWYGGSAGWRWRLRTSDASRSGDWGWGGNGAVVEVTEAKALNCRGKERVSVTFEMKQRMYDVPILPLCG